MALQFNLEAEVNHLGTAFPDAYWSIDNLGIGMSNGVYGVAITLRAYPNRDSKKLSERNDLITERLSFGGSSIPYYNGALYEYQDFVAIEKVYPDGIPNTYDGMKKLAYIYIKSYFSEIPFEDVFEESQLTEIAE